MISQERLKELLSYNPKTGIWKWIVKASNVEPGTIAGCSDGAGYLVFSVDGRQYKAHRLAWLYVHGKFPEFIDHINGVRDDNRIANLRDVTKGENQKNQKMHSTNTSGYVGVGWFNLSNKWRATIKVNGRQTHLGLFNDLATTIWVREMAAIRHGFHANPGRCNKDLEQELAVGCPEYVPVKDNVEVMA